MILTSPSRDGFATGAAFDPETFRFFQDLGQGGKVEGN
jgi:hypothetical protein